MFEIVQDHKSRLGEAVRIILAHREIVGVNADRERIAEVISNILANAIKFTTKGFIIISVQSQDNSGVVSVCDSGPGIDPDLFPILFSRFGKKSYVGNGMGLGLYISKRIIEAHHGSITARNNVPPVPGATFEFALPLEAQPTSMLPQTISTAGIRLK